MPHRLFASLAALLFAGTATLGTPALAQSVYEDPAQRFRLEVPRNWNPTQRRAGSVTLESRTSAATIAFSGETPEAVLESLLKDYGTRWTQVRERERSRGNLGGAAATVVVLDGVDTRGAAAVLRITVARLGEGTVSVTSRVPKASYGLGRLTLENIEESVTAGSEPAPPPEAPDPAAVEKAALEDLYRSGIVSREPAPAPAQASTAPRPALGVRVRDPEPGEPSGAALGEVLPGGAAHQAGLRKGDLIVRLDGVPIASAAALSQAVARRKPGESVQLEWMREGTSLSGNVTLGSAR